MSKCYSIGDIMSMYYEKEFLTIDEVTCSQFSSKHSRRMKKAFNSFAKNKDSICCQHITTKAKKSLSIRNRIILAAIIIVFLALVTGCVIAFISDSFRGTVYNDNTHLFAFDTSGSPSHIEKVYTLSVIPEGYELYDITQSSFSTITVYKDMNNNEFHFIQRTKEEFNPHINTEGFEFEEMVINGCEAVCVDYSSDKNAETLVIWNNKEYILSIEGNFTKYELLNLANINEKNGF